LRRLLSGPIVIILVLILILPPFSSSANEIDNKEGKPFLTGKALAKQETIAKMSGNVMLHFAEQHGLGSIMGKQIGLNGNPDGPESPLPGTDVIVGGDGAWHENEPSIAANSTNPDKMVVASHRFDGGSNDPCAVWHSVDGGDSWMGPVSLPLTRDYCSDPVVRYSPDGKAVYALYMDIDDTTADIVVTKSTDNGVNWGSPVIAIEGLDYDDDGFLDFPDKPWLDVTENNVYVSTTVFDNDDDCSIFFTRSLNQGTTFEPHQVLASSDNCDPVIQGSRPQAGIDSNVLVCWYHSGSDGWLAGGFETRCKNSINNGGSFGEEERTAFSSNGLGLFEVPFWLCPDSDLHRAWGSMFPAITIDKNGKAHIVVTADPTIGDRDGECGDIYYVSSTGSPHDTWSSPIKISNDNSNQAQLYATITTHPDGETLVAAWEDHRNSEPCNFPTVGRIKQNCHYDIYFTQGTTLSSSSNQRVTDASSLSDYTFIGDYMDATPGSSVDLVWTDRRDKTSIFDQEDDVLFDKVESPGLDTTPPSVSVSHSPTSPTSSDNVIYTATASDNVGVTSITINVDGVDVPTCSSSPCIYDGGTYSDGTTHNYNATAEDGPTNIGRDPNTGTKSFTVNDAVSDTLEVDSIAMSGDAKSRGGTMSCKAKAEVTIVDQFDDPVADAIVDGIWSVAFSDTVSGTTNGKGKISFRTSWVGCGVFVFTVDKINGSSLDPNDSKNFASILLE